MSKKVTRSPREGIADTRLRGDEKRKLVLLWLAEYQYSTLSIMAEVLGVTSTSQWPFFNRLIAGGIVRRIGVETVRGKLFLLTPVGRELAAEFTEKALDVLTEPNRVTVSTVRHNLCVQWAVLARLQPGMNHTFEKHLKFADKDKVPDALLEHNGRLTALEIELSHKRTNRVYRAFYDHINAMKDKQYFNVEYVFSNVALRNNYQAKFDEKEWPIIERRKGQLIQSERVFQPDSMAGLRDRFTFVVQDFDAKK